jgi:hypothetical protein
MLMATIAENQASMTIMYYKSNGDIYTIGSGIHDIATMFGDHSADMALMLDEIVLPIDKYVLDMGMKIFKMDVTQSPPVLSLKPVEDVEVPAYPTAPS